MRLNCLLSLLLLTSTGWAHPLADQAKAIEEQSLVLRQRMGPDNPNLTWGQKMALDDITRLASAASAARQALTPEDVDWDSCRATLVEMQVAGNRVRMSLPVSVLDSEGQTLGQQMVLQVQEIDKEARAERDQHFDRQVASARPSISFGLGFGNYWGSPWRSYGYGFGGGCYPGYFGGYRGGYGRPCR
ncbi:hypothetical protein IV102_08525 [bacterium]|nr:hypothetical protein [bacterium]